MQIELDRADVLKLIDADEISKAGVTITMRDSRQKSVAAQPWDRAHPERTDGTFSYKRMWEPARELETRKP